MIKNERMRILIVVCHPVGGIRTYFRDVYCQALFDDCDFTILLPTDRISDLEENVFKDRNVQYISFKDNIDLIKHAWRVLGEKKFDLVNSHGFTAGLLAVAPTFIRRMPHLMTSHDIFQESQFKGISGFVRRRLIGVGLKLIDCNMAVGDEARDNLHEYFPFLQLGTKLIAIKNGIDVERFSNEDRRDFRQELNLTDECILLGFFGRFMKQKGFRYLVEAVGELRASKPLLDFKVITFGWGGFIREEQGNIIDMGLEDMFVFMPHTDDMSAAIHGVDAVIMPSLWEACPLLPMEAMVSGIPLISSDCIGLNEVTANSPAISFARGDVEALKSAMTKFFGNDLLYKSRAIEFKEQAYQRYDVCHTARKLREQYQRMSKCVSNE